MLIKTKDLQSFIPDSRFYPWVFATGKCRDEIGSNNHSYLKNVQPVCQKNRYTLVQIFIK